MIITLVKADFSSNNVGTLSTWSVTKQFEAGVTLVSPVTLNSIDREGTASTSVTLSVDTANYTLDSAKVYMGGVDKSGEWGVNTTNLPNITFTIPAGNALTGNIVIDIDTTRIGGGVEDEPEEPSNPTPDVPSTTTGLSYKLNRNIDTTGTISIYNGRIAIPEFFETNGAAVTVSHSGGLEVLLRYYTEDKVFQSTADGSTYCRLVLRTDNEGSSDVGGTPLTNDTVNNTTLTINGTVYTLTNKIEENEIMYWINTNLNNKSPFLQVWNDRLTIDDSFATNGTEATVAYNGSNYTVSSIASRYFKTYTYVTDKATSSNVRFVFVGNTGSTNATAGTAITNNNILDGETLTVNDTVYTFI